MDKAKAITKLAALIREVSALPDGVDIISLSACELENGGKSVIHLLEVPDAVLPCLEKQGLLYYPAGDCLLLEVAHG